MTPFECGRYLGGLYKRLGFTWDEACEHKRRCQRAGYTFAGIIMALEHDPTFDPRDEWWLQVPL